jgi:hypothetical protein
MQPATLNQLKQELATRSSGDLLEICLRLSKYKKDNKELLNYLLFESFDESLYVANIKAEIDGQFDQINKTNYYYIRKSIRKILITTRKYIRYSQQKETEIELLIYFCNKLKSFSPPIHGNTQLKKLFDTQLGLIRKKVSTLHEDLQFDYGVEINSLLS